MHPSCCQGGLIESKIFETGGYGYGCSEDPRLDGGRRYVTVLLSVVHFQERLPPAIVPACLHGTAQHTGIHFRLSDRIVQTLEQFVGCPRLLPPCTPVPKLRISSVAGIGMGVGV